VERNVYHANEIFEDKFYKLPKQLFSNTYYRDLKLQAKILYSILRDRMELSKENNWINKRNEVFLVFTRESIGELLGLSKPTVVEAFKQLRKKGLIFEERQGSDRPNKIFIGRIDYSKGVNVDISGRLNNLTTESKDSLPPEVKKFNPNDTELNETEKNETDTKGSEIFPNEAEKTSFKKAVQKLSPNEYAIENVSYYLAKYKKIFNKEHPQLRLDQWQEVFSNIVLPYSETFNKEYELLGKDFQQVVDKHFQTRYNNCDYNILHFISGDIMTLRAFEVIYG
jgi:DNA-binding transcriptional ArsR family regulator